ncbi:DUF488 domain-containing protein [Latilactobacillus graminis]|uniref:Uncharacterized protein n=2 Tax=Latilactobacillus graminis TaxID=60519 RepID=A0AA89I0A1_9LACO|nr:DUF488 family protein [Latilactobacillus graminis]KRM22261.1 hypothetical protein FC90_GL000860 [Latilactobacillus graminis DSM 20719]QFP79563.1 DUF488 family protein [Latilactobacillus graminis]
MLQMKRAYEAVTASDGYRILVDRIWPRGITKERGAIENWAKMIAPTTALRKWFDHDPAKFSTFKEKYLAEIADNPAWPEFEYLVDQQLAVTNVTLVYAAKDPHYNHVAVLMALLKKNLDNQ